MRGRIKAEGKPSDWEKEKGEFFKERGKKRKMKEEREEGSMDFGTLEERDRNLQREERLGNQNLISGTGR